MVVFLNLFSLHFKWTDSFVFPEGSAVCEIPAWSSREVGPSAFDKWGAVWTEASSVPLQSRSIQYSFSCYFLSECVRQTSRSRILLWLSLVFCLCCWQGLFESSCWFNASSCSASVMRTLQMWWMDSVRGNMCLFLLAFISVNWVTDKLWLITKKRPSLIFEGQFNQNRAVREELMIKSLKWMQILCFKSTAEISFNYMIHYNMIILILTLITHQNVF